MASSTIKINGRLYDSHTGIRIMEETKQRQAHKAGNLHRRTQNSKTLNRRYISNDQMPKVVTATAVKPAKAKTQHTTHPSVRKFAPQISDIRKVANIDREDTAPIVHPTVKKAEMRRPQQSKRHPKVAATPIIKPSNAATYTPSSVLKNQAIEKAMNSAAPRGKHGFTPDYFKRRAKRQRFSMAATVMAFTILGGYFTYLYMPNVSVRVAASQAGVDASYPSYKPAGYSLSGPVAYSSGEVKIKFVANASPLGYTITQSQSDWDSSAVLDNYVQPKVGDNYTTNRENGLTVYTYNNNAAWVNKGILYTISGDAPLSSDQVRRIALSM